MNLFCDPQKSVDEPHKAMNFDIAEGITRSEEKFFAYVRGDESYASDTPTPLSSPREWTEEEDPKQKVAAFAAAAEATSTPPSTTTTSTKLLLATMLFLVALVGGISMAPQGSMIQLLPSKLAFVVEPAQQFLERVVPGDVVDELPQPMRRAFFPRHDIMVANPKLFTIQGKRNQLLQTTFTPPELSITKVGQGLARLLKKGLLFLPLLFFAMF